MKRIEITSENIDELYTKINELIDSYFEWNIKPSSLKKYLKKGSIGLKKFIERNELGNISRIDKVIMDVIDDRFGMEGDGVLTFENFDHPTLQDIGSKKGHDWILYSDMKDSNTEYEKIIADKYRTSLGHIEVMDESEHRYTVREHNNNFDVIIFSKEDLTLIEKNLNEFVYEHLKGSQVKMNALNLTIDLSDLLSSKEDLKSKLNLGDNVIDIISEVLQNDDYKPDGSDFKGYHFWTK